MKMQPRPQPLALSIHPLYSVAGRYAWLAALLAAPIIAAASGNDTWTGLGADSNWNTSGNWTGANTPPVAGDSLFFDGILNTAAADNMAAGTAFGGITFNSTAGAFTLTGNAITLGGGITNNAAFGQTISLAMALQATEPVNTGGGAGGQLTFSGIISGTGFGLTQSGGGLLALGGANTFGGPVTITGGTLSVAADTGLGAAPGSATPGSIVLNGGNLRTSAAITIGANRGISLGSAAGGSGAIDTGNATTSVASVYDGILANNGGIDSFIKTGLGTLTLGGANSYTGNTIVNQGTLKLDFTQSSAPAANIINSGSTLMLSGLSTSLGNSTAAMATAVAPGATLNVTGNASGARSQTLNGLVLSNGLGYVTTAQTSAQNVLLSLGGITNFGGAVDFTLGGTFSSGVNAITTTTLNDFSGILGGEAVYGTTAGQPTAYAAVDGSGNIVAYTGYSNVTANAAGIISNPTNNVRINNTAVATTSLAGSPTTANINTLTLNVAANSTLNMAAGDTLRLGTNGGLMVTYNNWGLTIGQTAGQGTLTAGGAANNTPGILNLLLDSQNGGIVANSVIADNGTGAVSLNIASTQRGNNSVGGAYGVVLNAANTFSGGTVIAGGQGNAENPAAFGTGPVTVLNGGQAYLGVSGTYPNAFRISGSGTSYNGGASALRINSGGAVVSNTITLLNDAAIGTGTNVGGLISSVIGGNGNLTLGDGAGWFTLTGANIYTGNTTVGSGVVEFGNRNALYGGNTANWTGGRIRAGSGGTLALALGSSPYFSVTDLTNIMGMTSSTTSGFEPGSSLGLDTTYAGGSFSYAGNLTNVNAGVTKLGSGTLTLSGTNSYVGATTVSSGTLSYSGQLGIAPATAAGQLIANNLGSNAILNVSAPANLRFNNNSALIGDSAIAGGNSGAFYQSGGNVSGINQLQLGAVTGGSYGYYNLSGGTNSITEFDLAGFNGAALGVCDISGGMMNVTNWFVPSRGTAAIGILNMTGGAFNYFGPAGQFEANWNSGVGTAVLNIANASLVASNANINMMQTGVAGKLGEINLLGGGLLQANSIAPGSATGTSMVNFNGGTLKANAATATFLTANNTAANVFSSGGVIDNNGVNITIPIVLRAPAGSGINSPVSVNGGSGYIGAPAVTFTGGSGTGAAGYATVSGGAVTGIVVTSPGINYSTAPTVVISGGGGTGASATAPAPTANSSGGLTFIGSGTTTLSAANTYTGNTTVSNGTLLISGSVAGGVVIGSGTLNVSGSVSGGATLNGGTLIVNGGSIGGAVAVNPGAMIASSTGTFGGLVTLNSGSSTINLLDGTTSTITFQNGLTLNNGNQLSLDIGASADLISVSGGSFSHSGTVTVNLNAIAAITSGATYTIITDAANDIATTNGFIVGTTPSGYSATLGTSGGALTVTVTQSAPSTAYWKGDLGTAWNTVSGGLANWTTDAAGAVNAVNPPGTPTAVTFAATGAANFNTILGANFTINNLTLSTANNVTIAGTANTLGIISGLTNAGTALNNTISVSNVILGASQTWENDSANPLTVSSLISGAAGLTIAGSGTIVFTGTNTYTGGTTISAGTLQLGSGSGGNGVLPVGITNNSLLLIANPNAQTFSTAVSGTGVLETTGSGLLTLPVANTYTGGTLISAGTVQVNNYNAFGTAPEFMTTGTVTNNGSINLNIGGGGTGWFFYPLSGSGTVNIMETANQESRIDGNMAGFTGTIIVPASSGSSKADIEGGAINWSNAATIIISNGGTLFVESAKVGNAWSGQAEQLAATIYVSGNGNSEGFGALRVDDGAIISGNVILQGNTVYGGTFTSPNGASGVSGVIDDQGNGYGIFCANNNNGGQAEEFWGANTYHGPTVWTNALYTLVLGNGSALQNSTLNIGPGQLRFDNTVSSNTFILGGLTGIANIALTNTSDSAITLMVGNNNADSTFTGNLTDGGTGSAFVKLGTGSLTLAGVNTYSGLTTVNGGNLTISTLQTNATAGITVNDGAGLTLNISGTNQLAPATYILGSSTGATNLFVGLASPTFAPVNAGSLVLNGTSTINIGGGAFTVGSIYPLIAYGSLSGTGNVVLGSLPHGLVANLVTVGGNTIALHVSAYVPSVDVWTGNINTNWDITTTTNWLVGGLANVYYDGDITRFDDAAATANVFVKATVSPNSVVVSNNVKTYTFAGSAISGAGGLTKQGSGTLVLNLTNTYNGNTVIAAGTLQLAAVNAIPGGAGKGDVTVNSTLDLNGHNELLNGLSGSGLVDTFSGGTPILSIGNSGSSSTFSGVIQNSSGTLTVTKNGSGTFTLSGNNTYSGPTTVNAGTLQAGSSTPFGSGLTTVANGAAVDLNGQSVTENLVLNSGATIANNSATAAVVAGNVTAANSSFTVINGVGNITFGTITHTSGNAQFDVTNLNTGTINLAGTVDNSFLNMHVAAGTVILGKTGAAGQRATSALFVEGGLAQLGGTSGDQIYDGSTLTINSGTFDMNGRNETIGNLSGSAGAVLNSVSNTTSTLTIGGVNSTAGDFSGTIQNGAGVVALTKIGTGSDTLEAANTYTGNTTINGGTLYLGNSGSIGNTALINIVGGAILDAGLRSDQTLTLNSGQTLAGNGTVNGSCIAPAGSTISPGGANAIGTLSISDNTTLNGKLLLELNRTNTPSNCDQLSIGGTPTYGGTLAVTNIGEVLQAGDTFQLFPSAASGFTVNLATTDSHGQIYTWTNKVAIDGSVQVLSVAPPVNLNPTNITASVSGSTLTLSWPADHLGWHLQVQTNSLSAGLGTNWVTISGSDTVTSTNITINPANGTVFYRMVYP